MKAVMQALILRREAMLPQEERHYLKLGRSTAPWYTRWLLWLGAWNVGDA